ncbi:hypothetical protein, partial [Nocardioides sp.]|uniref:hypothetical protein n=1 Tax=Nocardioides sp. TaxID=35761 RepID=UPI002736E18D
MTAAIRIDALDADATLRRAARVLTERRACEVEDLRLVAHWAGLHGHLHTTGDERRDEGVDERGRRVKGAEQLVQVGGDGTPLVAEFAIAELACLREVHPASCRAATADVLDLHHRLPHTWKVVAALRCDAWVARKVAVMTRHLDRFAVGLGEQAVAASIGAESPSRVLTIAEAKTIEADTPAHRARLEEQRRRRYVSLSRTDEHGLRHLIARIHTADAIWIDAMLNRIADLTAHQHPGATHDELRSHAMGWLARPAELLQLLLTGTQTDTDHDNPEGEESTDSDTPDTHGHGHGRGHDDAGPVSPGKDGVDGDPADDEQPANQESPVERPAGERPGTPEEPVVDEEDPHTGDPLPPEPADHTPSRAIAFPADLLGALASCDPAKLRPRTTVYLHLHQAALAGHCAGVARVEESGPVDLTGLHELFRHAFVKVTPVLDLAD